MQIKHLKESLPYLFKAGITPMLIGPHGIGKSQAMQQFCDDNGDMLFDLRLSTQETGDLIGLPDFTVDETTGIKYAFDFMPPKWLTNLIEFCNKNPNKRAVIFLDEINRARREVLQAVFQLVLDRKLHTIVLPKNCYTVAAMNPNTEDYIVSDITDKAFMDRFCHIILKPSVLEWTDWAKENSFDSNILSFIGEQPEMIQEKCAEFSLKDIKPSRRSWDAVNRLRKANTPENLFKELAGGLVGMTATMAFITHLVSTDKPLSALDVLNNYTKGKPTTNEEKIQKYSSQTTSRIDIIKATCDNVLEHVTKNVKITKKQFENLGKFLVEIPADVSFSFGRDAYLLNHISDMFEQNEALKEKWSKAKKGDIKDSIKKVNKKKI